MPGRGLRLPTRIRSLRVDPSIHLDVVKEGSAVVRVDPKMDMVLAGGVELCGELLIITGLSCGKVFFCSNTKAVVIGNHVHLSLLKR